VQKDLRLFLDVLSNQMEERLTGNREKSHAYEYAKKPKMKKKMHFLPLKSSNKTCMRLHYT
jgi:hypothetical protein